MHLPSHIELHVSPSCRLFLELRISFVIVFISTHKYNATLIITNMQDGSYLDANTAQLHLTLATYSTSKATFGYTTWVFTWEPSGIIRANVQISTLPAVPYISWQDRYSSVTSTLFWEVSHAQCSVLGCIKFVCLHPCLCDIHVACLYIACSLLVNV